MEPVERLYIFPNRDLLARVCIPILVLTEPPGMSRIVLFFIFLILPLTSGIRYLLWWGSPENPMKSAYLSSIGRGFLKAMCLHYDLLLKLSTCCHVLKQSITHFLWKISDLNWAGDSHISTQFKLSDIIHLRRNQFVGKLLLQSSICWVDS